MPVKYLLPILIVFNLNANPNCIVPKQENIEDVCHAKLLVNFMSQLLALSDKEDLRGFLKQFGAKDILFLGSINRKCYDYCIKESK